MIESLNVIGRLNKKQLIDIGEINENTQSSIDITQTNTLNEKKEILTSNRLSTQGTGTRHSTRENLQESLTSSKGALGTVGIGTEYLYIKVKQELICMVHINFLFHVMEQLEILIIKESKTSKTGPAVYNVMKKKFHLMTVDYCH
ncbi:7949_t:CDS:2 [Diversispora eburnea]|uniref:7949_t:CDS:1 n=1 Tax=Diversispora eburnea TaxID=1213867 RepID=A0A9N9GAP7_9GLOM|nr:7949_t:CDS:2 [Diversispora eburnea]